MNRSGLCMCGCGAPTPIAQRTTSRYGIKKGEPLHYLPGHQHRKASIDFLEDPETGCWMWQLGATGSGYPMTTVAGRRTYAHRALWEEFNGPIPPGWEADHLCCRAMCVNPGHVEPVERGENQRRQHARAKVEGRNIGAVAHPMLVH